MNLIEKILKGDHRATAQLISRLEDDPAGEFTELKIIKGLASAAHILGVTGAPGVGKSTLIARLIECYRRDRKKVAVLAVDPSSPVTGGAVLGDRIRMQHSAPDDGLFIRSMGTRGHLGGLSRVAAKAVAVLEGWGADTVIVETVGVGQAEVEIMDIADTILVVLAPGLGDDIQFMKAGIMEIADIFAINKSDLAKSGDLLNALHRSGSGRKREGWNTGMLQTAALSNAGMEELYGKIADHRKYLEERK